MELAARAISERLAETREPRSREQRIGVERSKSHVEIALQ